MKDRWERFACLYKDVNDMLKMTFAEKVFLVSVFVSVFAVALVVFKYVVCG